MNYHNRRQQKLIVHMFLKGPTDVVSVFASVSLDTVFDLKSERGVSFD